MFFIVKFATYCVAFSVAVRLNNVYLFLSSDVNKSISTAFAFSFEVLVPLSLASLRLRTYQVIDAVSYTHLTLPTKRIV